MPTFDVGGVPVHAAVAGDGAPVMLVHSGGYDGSQWRGLAPLLTGYRTVAPDLYGYGRTGAWPGPQDMSLDDDAALLLGLAAQLGEPLHLVGHSYGGAIALRAALADARPWRSVTLIEPMSVGTLRLMDDPTMYLALRGLLLTFFDLMAQGRQREAAGLFVDYWNARPGMFRALPEPVQARLGGVAHHIMRGSRALLADPTDAAALAGLRPPTLLLGMERSVRLMQELMPALAGYLPQATLQRLPGQTHMSLVSDAAPVAGALLAFMGDSDLRRAP